VAEDGDFLVEPELEDLLERGDQVFGLAPGEDACLVTAPNPVDRRAVGIA
jgi:hypothetical protein